MASPAQPQGSIPPHEHQEFINRYQQNPLAIPEQEALARYQDVAPRLPAPEYQQAAYEAFQRMSPEERRQFAQYVGVQAQQRGYPFPDVNQNGVDDRYEDPRVLAQTTAQMQQQQPGLLGQLFGGGGGHSDSGGGPLSNPWAKGALGGIAAFGLARMLGGGGGHGGGLFGGGEHGGGFFGGGEHGGGGFFGGGEHGGGHGGRH